MSQPGGACLPQSSPCASSTGYSIALHNLPGAPAPGDYPFPDGIPGVMSLAADPAGPWQGLCLFQAPYLDGSTQVIDQSAPVKPTQCIQLTVTAATAVLGGQFQFPAGNWNAYAACWGAPPNPDGGQPCIADLPATDITDGGDPGHGYDPDSGTGQDNQYDSAITLTPYPSNSCCGPLIGLRFQQSGLWQVSLSPGGAGHSPAAGPGRHAEGNGRGWRRRRERERRGRVLQRRGARWGRRRGATDAAGGGRGDKGANEDQKSARTPGTPGSGLLIVRIRHPGVLALSF